VALTSPSQLLQYAQDRLGRNELAKRLRVGEETITAWLAEPDDMPNRNRLALADLIHELTDPGHKKYST
jgi:hypothetical protein